MTLALSCGPSSAGRRDRESLGSFISIHTMAVDISARGHTAWRRCVMISGRGIAWWGCVMIEARITFYVFYLATAAVACMLVYKVVELFMT